MKTRKYTPIQYIQMAAILAAYLLLIWSLSSCNTTKHVQKEIVHDTINIYTQGSTDYIYKDTGSKVTEYLPYFVHVKDTFYQPINRIIEKAGKETKIHDTVTIKEKYDIKRDYYLKNVKRPATNNYIFLAFLVLLIALFAAYNVFK